MKAPKTKAELHETLRFIVLHGYNVGSGFSAYPCWGCETAEEAAAYFRRHNADVVDDVSDVLHVVELGKRTMLDPATFIAAHKRRRARWERERELSERDRLVAKHGLPKGTK